MYIHLYNFYYLGGPNMYAQLEQMMAAVKKEAVNLESMKVKIKEMEEIKAKMPELKRKLKEAEDNNLLLQKSLKESESVNNIFVTSSFINSLTLLYVGVR